MIAIEMALLSFFFFLMRWDFNNWLQLILLEPVLKILDFLCLPFSIICRLVDKVKSYGYIFVK